MQSMLKSNQKQITIFHVRSVVMTNIKHAVIVKFDALQKLLLFKRVQSFKRMMLDEMDYTVPIDLEKLESCTVNKEHETLKERVLYKIDINHFNHEVVDQETSSS